MASQRPNADTYVVEGRGEFPVDMLRKDCAEPATDEDRAKIDATFESGLLPRELRRVMLQTREPWTADERWESFGWRVVQPLRPWGERVGYRDGETTEERFTPNSPRLVTIQILCADLPVANEVQSAVRTALEGRDDASVEHILIQAAPDEMLQEALIA
ncbi:hypothetical protein [Sphingomonas sp. 3-13AW]|uniref:hypothetical protein n=1 Tax=Sphingomonas sp. 3-13AW TaxID=3050450 RepID=UPI003BB75CC9